MGDDVTNRIGVVCGYPFPNGMAPTARILAYSRGLIQAGATVDVFIYFPTDKMPDDFPVDGEIAGVRYHYPYFRDYPPNRVLRALSHPFFLILTCIKVIVEHRRMRFDFLFVSSDWIRVLYTFIPLAKLLRIRPVFIADEYPTPIRVYLKNTVPALKMFLFKQILRYVDRMVFMTYGLLDFYNKIVSKPSHILPTVIDLTRFTESRLAVKNTNRTLRYMGNLELSKDNVDNIIEAFSMISEKYPDLRFEIYGEPSKRDFKTLNETIERLKVQDCVKLMGKVRPSEVPELLRTSYILVSSQPDTIRAKGGFPTKLGEYMAVGVPTVVTDVGEIRLYVKDGESVWLAKPHDPQDYARKLKYILDNYDDALQVAARARHLVSENFGMESQGFKLKSFLYQNISKYK